MTILFDDYSSNKLENQKAITINDCKEDVGTLKNIFRQAQLSSLVDYEKHIVSQQLEYKAHGNRYGSYLNANGLLAFSVVLGADSLAKALKNEGFEVSVSDSKKFLVKW